MTTRHTGEEVERAAERYAKCADELDPDTASVDITDDLRAVAVASAPARVDEARLREDVEVARAHGRFWNQIAVALGVSREAARQRLASKVDA